MVKIQVPRTVNMCQRVYLLKFRCKLEMAVASSEKMDKFVTKISSVTIRTAAEMSTDEMLPAPFSADDSVNIQMDIKATSDQEKANLLQKKFQSVWTQKKSPLLIESGPNESIDCPAKATLHALQNLDVKKAPGPDGISPRILRKMSIAIAPALSHIISLSWRNSEIPSDWKKTVVVPIPKKARSSNPEDYRPISLTCIVSKIVERFVYT